jgi:hypothetical protein
MERPILTPAEEFQEKAKHLMGNERKKNPLSF